MVANVRSNKADRHARRYYEATARNPSNFAHFSSGPYKSAADFISSFLLKRSYVDPSMFTYAIIDKARLTSGGAEGDSADREADALAGMVSLVNADLANRRADIGILHILPDSQSKGLGWKVASILVEYGMSSTAGLGLARMEWRATSSNEPSIRLARKLGFREVGVICYEKLLKDGVARGKIGNGRPAPHGTKEGDLWRDVVVFEMVHHDWSVNQAQRGEK